MVVNLDHCARASPEVSGRFISRAKRYVPFALSPVTPAACPETPHSILLPVGREALSCDERRAWLRAGLDTGSL